MKRTITEAQRAWLVDELAAWRDTGLIDDALSRALLGLYQTSDELGQARQNRAIAVLTTLGALLVGLGILLLLGYNWEAMPSAVKVGLIVLTLVTVQSVGLYLRFQRGKPDAADIVFFFGSLLYGAGIWLIAQIFHLSAQDGAAFWWWAAGVLPFALAGNSLALHALYAGLLAVWVGVEMIGYPDLGFWMFGRWPALPNGAYGLIAMVVPGLVWSYRRRSPRALGLYLPVLTWWAVLMPFAWHINAFPVYFIGALGALLLIAGELHPESSLMALPFRFYGGALIGGVLLPISFFSFNQRGGPWAWDGQTESFFGLVVQPFVVLLIAAVLLTIAAMRQSGSATRAERLTALARRTGLPLGLGLLMVGLGLWRALVDEPWLPTITANVAMLALSYWLLQHGLRDDRGVPFAAGTGYFLLWTVVRYVDLFGDFGGMLGGALMFFLCGAALFGVTAYWRHRTHGQSGKRASKDLNSPIDPWSEPEVHHAGL